MTATRQPLKTSPAAACALRLGMLLPSGNLVAERQMLAMLPACVALHVTRLPLTGSSDAQLRRMTDGLDDAARLLGDTRADLIAFNCTAVSAYEPNADVAIKKQIEDATGIRAVATAEALVEALRHLNATRIALITPYIEPVTEREIAFFRHHGFDVVHDASYGIDTNWDMAHEPEETWERFMLANRHDDADAYLLSCTAIESARVIAPLEARLGKPVLTSNQALAWLCLREGGVHERVGGFGALLEPEGAAHTLETATG